MTKRHPVLSTPLLLVLALLVTLAPVAWATPATGADLTGLHAGSSHDDEGEDDEGEDDEGEDDEGEDDEGEDDEGNGPPFGEPGPPGGDDGPPFGDDSVIKFDQRVFTIFENRGEAVISVERSKGDDGAIAVEYRTEDGSATAGEDYTATSGLLEWADGDDERKTFTVELLDDDEFEVRETVELILEILDGDASLHPGKGRAILQIMDGNEDGGDGEDDESGPGELSFEDDEFQAIEDAGSAVITVERDDGSEGVVSVVVSTAGGSASDGEDYEAVSEVVTWGDGDDDDKTVEVPILEDDLEEGNEYVELVLSDPTGGATLDDDMADLVILDNDGSTTTCVEDDETLCLAGDRFRITVDWRTPQGDSGAGQVEEVSDTSGLVSFFNPDNKEMLIKVLDACTPPFNAYWVFFAATTNVDFTVTVTDTATGIVKEYTNPSGQAAEPVQDTVTFETCS